LKLGISKRKHIPVLYTNADNQTSYPIWQYKQVKEIDKTGLLLDTIGKLVVLNELKTGTYTPPFSIENKTVLDIGASNGETAWFFLMKLKAKRVICVECDEQRLAYMQRNKRVLNLNIDIIAEPFKIEHLADEYDFIKCDVEGYEMILINYMNQGNKLKPCVVEAHTSWIMNQFKQKDFKVQEVLADNSAGVCIYMMNNYDQFIT
jgi:hypothetical protein